MNISKENLRWKDAAIAALIFLLPAMIIMSGTLHIAVKILLCTFGTVGVMMGRLYCASNIKKRIDQPNSPEWDVFMNGVKVGVISDADYARIGLVVFNDWRNYALAAGDLLKFVVSLTSSIVYAIPIAAFWACVVGIYFAPDSMQSLLAQIQVVGGKGVIEFLSSETFATLGLTIIVSVCGLMIAFGRYETGKISRFFKARNDALRWHLDIASVGDLSLVRFDSGKKHVDDLVSMRGIVPK